MLIKLTAQNHGHVLNGQLASQAILKPEHAQMKTIVEQRVTNHLKHNLVHILAVHQEAALLAGAALEEAEAALLVI